MSNAADLKPLLLRRPALTLAVAESLTAGHVQARIAAVAGASGYFLGGVTAYSLAQKVRLLGVNRAHARAVDCVSQRVAVEMAAGAAKLFGADLAVATTGYAEPAPGKKIRIPQAWWAICHQRRGAAVVLSGFIEVPGADRVTVQERVAEAVLVELVNYLREVRAEN
ncbi:Nicotinamide-nucleotide amidohydrolase PncC [Lacunisphaera limnophila]|uniref:Nicotinamide-nucleotide amidohydrolase PncC n=1 Tax=Lacunisphaera limnophila TaxID=1838286 RepID=A0A1D8AU37_9BACT|nr:CinA family protein [Lacunisphaera limnophila]AOS44408.1 Nicotinamide-nucleotide amidohydrolase PncC [Lacunisphaera limnophila]